jgi:translation elongation factor EF-G
MWKMYKEVLSTVEPQVAQLQSILRQAKDKKLERIWLRNRSDGELDDTRLVEGVAGERLVFKKRGTTESKSKSDDDDRRENDGGRGLLLVTQNVVTNKPWAKILFALNEVKPLQFCCPI